MSSGYQSRTYFFDDPRRYDSDEDLSRSFPSINRLGWNSSFIFFLLLFGPLEGGTTQEILLCSFDNLSLHLPVLCHRLPFHAVYCKLFRFFKDYLTIQFECSSESFPTVPFCCKALSVDFSLLIRCPLQSATIYVQSHVLYYLKLASDVSYQKQYVKYIIINMMQCRLVMNVAQYSLSLL